MISKSLVDISSFSVLLFLLMFIYILLGMELFSIKMADEDGQTKAKIPRNNFNTFFSSFIVIFTVLTGENWDETMLQYARYEAITSIVFFISLIIIGVMIFLNLFLAILLDNFDDVEDDSEDQATEGLFK
jgi:magnesium-transporting ATPase (P-type)